jgi:predicted MFS family arabinose efflux permease
MSAETFKAWGWRIPFLLSAVLLAVGMYIRVTMHETPVFQREINRKGTSRVPAFEAIRTQPTEMLLSCLVEVPALALLYLTLTYIMSYGVSQLRLAYSEVLWVTVASGLVMFIGIRSGSVLADRVGRRTVLVCANGLATAWALVIFPILYTGTLMSYSVVVAVTMFVSGLIVGPIGAFMSELFRTRYRYTAVGLCYNVAGIIGGGLIPVVSAPIVTLYGPAAFGKILAAISFISFCCCVALRETKGMALDSD